MRLSIDTNSHVPIYLQIAEGIKSTISSGVLKPGAALPSLRALGVEILVNPNTVQRAYDELERDGLIYSRRGVGMFVAEIKMPATRRRDERAVVAAFRRAIESGLAAGITPGQIQLLYEHAFRHVRQGVGGR
jgi:GntR family transcriptional regulator